MKEEEIKEEKEIEKPASKKPRGGKNVNENKNLLEEKQEKITDNEEKEQKLQEEKDEEEKKEEENKIHPPSPAQGHLTADDIMKQLKFFVIVIYLFQKRGFRNILGSIFRAW